MSEQELAAKEYEKLQQYLRPYREDESQLSYSSAILVGDRAAHRVLVTWTMLPVTWVHPAAEIPEDSRLLWEWLWVGVRIPWDILASRSGLDLPRIQKIFEPLRANRLVYPDGTAPAHALAVLKAEVVKGLPKSSKSQKSR